MTNFIKLKNWNFANITEVKPSPCEIGHYVVVHNGRKILRHYDGLSRKAISMNYTVSWFKWQSYTVARWSFYTVFFDSEMREVEDPREQVNNGCNWVELNGNVSCVDEYGEIFDTYSPEYCRLRGLDLSDYLERVGDNRLSNE